MPNYFIDLLKDLHKFGNIIWHNIFGYVEWTNELQELLTDIMNGFEEVSLEWVLVEDLLTVDDFRTSSAGKCRSG